MSVLFILFKNQISVLEQEWMQFVNQNSQFGFVFPSSRIRIDLFDFTLNHKLWINFFVFFQQNLHNYISIIESQN